MTAFPVIIDNDSLGHLAFIDDKYPVINRLKTIFTAIHIPDEVLDEFEYKQRKKPEPERQKIISEAYTPGKFFKKCSSYDSISKAFLQTKNGIDIGEAAAVAQHQKIHSRFIISEDKKFHTKIAMIYPGIRLLKLKHVFAILDLHGLMNNWTGCMTLLHQRRPFTSKELREAYSDMGKQYGMDVNKLKLSQKTGLKNLGIT